MGVDGDDEDDRDVQRGPEGENEKKRIFGELGERRFATRKEARTAFEDYALVHGFKLVGSKPNGRSFLQLVCSSQHQGCTYFLHFSQNIAAAAGEKAWHLTGFCCTHVNCTSRAQATADQISRMDGFRAAVKGGVAIKKWQLVRIVENYTTATLTHTLLYRARKLVLGETDKEYERRDRQLIRSFLEKKAGANTVALVADVPHTVPHSLPQQPEEPNCEGAVTADTALSGGIQVEEEPAASAAGDASTTVEPSGSDNLAPSTNGGDDSVYDADGTTLSGEKRRRDHYAGAVAGKPVDPRRSKVPRATALEAAAAAAAGKQPVVPVLAKGAVVVHTAPVSEGSAAAAAGPGAAGGTPASDLSPKSAVKDGWRSPCRARECEQLREAAEQRYREELERLRASEQRALSELAIISKQLSDTRKKEDEALQLQRSTAQDLKRSDARLKISHQAEASMAEKLAQSVQAVQRLEEGAKRLRCEAAEAETAREREADMANKLEESVRMRQKLAKQLEQSAADLQQSRDAEAATSARLQESIEANCQLARKLRLCQDMGAEAMSRLKESERMKAHAEEELQRTAVELHQSKEKETALAIELAKSRNTETNALSRLEESQGSVQRLEEKVQRMSGELCQSHEAETSAVSQLVKSQATVQRLTQERDDALRQALASTRSSRERAERLQSTLAEQMRPAVSLGLGLRPEEVS